jgi:CHASE3 domain sensor protein
MKGRVNAEPQDTRELDALWEALHLRVAQKLERIVKLVRSQPGKPMSFREGPPA